MPADAKTIGIYNRDAAAYADWVEPLVPRDRLHHFAQSLPAQADVLDLGCGSGWAAADLAKAGFKTRAIDRAEALAAEAKRRYGIDVEIGDIIAFDEQATLDGIWASFSLLHLQRDEMISVLSALARALRPEGKLYLGLKAGPGEARDDLGRYYCYWQQDELSALLLAAGFDGIEIDSETADGFDGEPSALLHVTACKPA